MSSFSLASKNGAIEYVRGRQGKDGGYLFYQYEDIFESAVDDTFYALSVLKSLGVEPPNSKLTLKFLRSKIADTSLYTAYYSTNAFNILGTRLRFSKRLLDFVSSLRRDQGIFGKLRKHKAMRNDDIPKNEEISPNYESSEIFEIELPSELELAFMVLNCHKKLGLKISENGKQDLAESVFNYLRPDGGFGSNASDINSTFYALRTLNLLDCPMESLWNTSEWILGLEDKNGGFNVSHRSRFRTVEYTYKAVEGLKMFRGRPKLRMIHTTFLLQCQNGNGGFRRSIFAGISTLKDTFEAVTTLESLLGSSENE